MMVLDLLADSMGAALRAGRGMDGIVWPARCQTLDNGMLLDAAHNPSSIAALTETLQTDYPGKRWEVLFGAAKDKDIVELLQLLELFMVCQGLGQMHADTLRLIRSSPGVNMWGLSESNSAQSLKSGEKRF